MPYNVDILLPPALVIFVVVLLTCILLTKSYFGSFLTASIKAGVFFLFFSAFFSGSVTGADDAYYLNTAFKLAQANFKFLDIFMHRAKLMGIAESAHIFYPVYNYYAIKLFGNFYFSPVVVNILLTLPIAYLGMRISRIGLDFSKRQATLFFYFLLLHPDILSWSSVFNGKDTLVLLCHAFLLFAFLKYYHGRKLYPIIISIFVIFILLGLRYFVPILFALSFLLFSLFYNRKGFKLKYLIVSFAIFSFFWIKQYQGFPHAIELISSTFINPLYGLIHFMLTPIPFQLDAVYKFLFLSSLFHWFCFPFLLFGIFIIFKKQYPFGKFLLIYFFTFVLLYSVFEGLQGARQRYQLNMAIAIFQFVGIRYLFLQFHRNFMMLNKHAECSSHKDSIRS